MAVLRWLLLQSINLGKYNFSLRNIFLLKVLNLIMFYMIYLVATLTQPLTQVLTHVNIVAELTQSKIRRRLNPNDPSRFAAVEKIAVDYCVIASESFKDYMNHIEPSRRRQIIAWSINVLMWASTFLLSILA